MDVDVELISKSIVSLEANLTPGSTYKYCIVHCILSMTTVCRITVFESTTVTDGYDLKLKRSSLNFLAAPIEHSFGIMRVATDVP